MLNIKVKARTIVSPKSSSVTQQVVMELQRDGVLTVDTLSVEEAVKLIKALTRAANRLGHY